MKPGNNDIFFKICCNEPCLIMFSVPLRFRPHKQNWSSGRAVEEDKEKNKQLTTWWVLMMWQGLCSIFYVSYFLIWFQLQYYEIGIMTSVLPIRNQKQLKVVDSPSSYSISNQKSTLWNKRREKGIRIAPKGIRTHIFSRHI